MTTMTRLPTLLLTTLILAGCSVAPPYERPAMAIPTIFKHAPTKTAAGPDAGGQWKTAEPADDLNRGEWWTIFQDADLDALQRDAYDANQDIRAAAARLQQSRAIQRGAQAERLPSVDAGFGPTRQRPSPASQGQVDDGAPRTATLWRAQASVSYEVDLFGRVANSVAAATAVTQRDQALFQSMLLALQADVAHTYFQLRELDAEQALYADALQLRADALRLMERRYQEGFIGELDVARSRAELAAAESESLALARRRATAEHALALLLGKAPVDFSLPASPLTGIDLRIPAGLPSTLLERRPDIAAAERAMAAANARVGIARAAYFPSLTLTGATGFEARELGDLLQWSSRSFLLGPLAGTVLSLPIFDGGRREASVARSLAAWEEEAAHYRQTVLNAFREVEDNLAGLRILAEQGRAQHDAVTAAERAATLSQIQYREGDVGYLDVIEANRSVLLQQRVAVQIDAERARTTVNLVRALGGGWHAPEEWRAAGRGGSGSGPASATPVKPG
ncbi:MAG: efflux transporter outer membrane subunit [Rhodocyclaceae bacterium]